MKAPRQVSRQFLRMIETYNRFKDSQVLVLKGQTGSELNDLLECDRSWRNIKIQPKQKRRGVLTEVVNLLQQNRETLRTLSLHSDFLEHNDICAVTLPRLTSLTVRTNAKGQETLKDFLGRHLSLEELDVSVEEEFKLSLLDVIKEHQSANLRKLHLKAECFVESREGVGQERVDWAFLGVMTRLEDFQLLRRDLIFSSINFGSGTRLLECLPRNQLVRLSFRGIGNKYRECGFWKVNEWEDEPELPFKLELLRGFRNLKVLRLTLCPDAVDDDVMQFIIREMTSLEELEVSQCSRLTDAGLAGAYEDGSDSIRNLKGLSSS